MRTVSLVGAIGLFLTIFLGFKKSFKINNSSKSNKVAYFASGCFWCVESIFESVDGVEEAVSGFSGGRISGSSYKETGTAMHAETVAVYYNADKISFKTLVDVFFGSLDPEQEPDFCPQYRSIAFYQTKEEKEVINKKIVRLLSKDRFDGKITAKVEKFVAFYQAEASHQNYNKLHPNDPYVLNVSIPRLNRFKNKFPHLLKK